MPTRVKICGITRREDAELAVEFGAAALGFNFYPPSPRYITPVAARDIIRNLPPFVVAVGVFADETDTAHVNAVAEKAGVSVVQLHGPKFPADECTGRYPVIRAIPIWPTGEIPGMVLDDLLSEGLTDQARQMGPFPSGVLQLKYSRPCAFLLDTADAVLKGGTGRTFDWKMARGIARRHPVILAGGLTHENVGQAIRDAEPYAVDVASGVESAAGVKDVVKLGAFIIAVEEADRQVEALGR